MVVSLPVREEVAREHTWAIDSIYASPADWEAAFNALEARLPELEPFRGKLGESSATLLKWLELNTQLQVAAGHLFVYAQSSFDVDSNNQAAGALVGRAIGLYSRLGAASSFDTPEILAIEPARLDQFIAEQPGLKIYRHYFDNILRQRDHIRSAEVEELLALAADPLQTPYNTYQVLSDGELKFRDAVGADATKAEVARGSIDKLLASPDRALRKSAWESYKDGFLSVKNTMASNLAGNIKTNVFGARARRYPDALSASLANSNIPNAVYQNVIDACNSHLPIWHRYWDIRRRALKLDKLEGFDIFAPLSTPVEVKYARAIDLICEGLAPLGADYVQTVRTGLTSERWVDVYPNKGKRGGAYSTGWYGTRPFILMSYNARVEDVSTLAHELGHSMHTWLTFKHQPFVYSGYSLFVAEIASNFHQALVRAHLLKTITDRNFQIAVLEEAMHNFHRYFFIMPILAQFELHIHRRIEAGEALTADGMGDYLAALYTKGYGSAVKVETPREGITWAEFGHLYANFYVYQYASGIAAANALADGVLSGESGAADRYLQFLKSGGSIYALDAVKLAGIDMTLPGSMDRGFKVFEGYVDRLENLLL
ncbi:MAG TPA: oligoendopeptidase F [Aggregatilineales bacterium]|nr:oligoendopeptidase F [Aggregatilineales bacterium]